MWSRIVEELDLEMPGRDDPGAQCGRELLGGPGQSVTDLVEAPAARPFNSRRGVSSRPWARARSRVRPRAGGCGSARVRRGGRPADAKAVTTIHVNTTGLAARET